MKNKTWMGVAAAAAVALRNAEEFQKRIVSAARHLHLLDRLDVHHGLHRIFGGIGQVGILFVLVRREMVAQRGGTLHLALDIGDLGPAVSDHGPGREPSGYGRQGCKAQK